MTANEIIQALVLVLTGGGLGGLLTAVVQARQQGQKQDHVMRLEDFRLFQATWKAEMARVHDELHQLRTIVVELSLDLESRGGDPFAVRRNAVANMRSSEPDTGETEAV